MSSNKIEPIPLDEFASDNFLHKGEAPIQSHVVIHTEPTENVIKAEAHIVGMLAAIMDASAINMHTANSISLGDIENYELSFDTLVILLAYEGEDRLSFLTFHLGKTKDAFTLH